MIGVVEFDDYRRATHRLSGGGAVLPTARETGSIHPAGVCVLTSERPSAANERSPSMIPDPPTVLVLCTGNSCRSHMAEGILRNASEGAFLVASAGSNPSGYVYPLAIKVMSEIGIDISGHTSKHMNEFLARNVETVITVCGNADQACPMFQGTQPPPLAL